MTQADCGRIGDFEIARKDFEGSIERKIELIMPFDQKLAAQAAKLGKPIAEVGKGSKTVAPLIGLAAQLVATGDDADLAPASPGVAASRSCRSSPT